MVRFSGQGMATFENLSHRACFAGTVPTNAGSNNAASFRKIRDLCLRRIRQRSRNSVGPAFRTPSRRTGSKRFGYVSVVAKEHVFTAVKAVTDPATGSTVLVASDLEIFHLHGRRPAALLLPSREQRCPLPGWY